MFYSSIQNGDAAMFDGILRMTASWDWFTPLIIAVQNWRYRPTTGYHVPLESAVCPDDLRNFLRSKGVRVWGLIVLGDVFSIRVRVAQASYAEYLMTRLGVAFHCTEPAAERPTQRAGTEVKLTTSQAGGRSGSDLIEAAVSQISEAASRMRSAIDKWDQPPAPP